MNKIDKILVEQAIQNGYLTKTKHPLYDIYILNYTPSAIFDKAWSDITMICRGLIIDSDYNILYRPFPKFFNYEEIPDKSIIPNLPFEVYDKLDGSLGILYWYNNKAAIATRGSFTSEQAVHATNILNTKYKNEIFKLDKSKTYLFEIIYPQNHIVVNYKDIDDIFLLAVIDTKTGLDVNFEIYSKDLAFNKVHKYDGITDYKEIRDIIDSTNKEGFVVKFSNSYRIKLKYSEYFRLHALISGITEKNILELLITDNIPNLLDLVTTIDEENAITVKKMVSKFYVRYSEIEKEARNTFNNYKKIETDKDAADIFLKYPYSDLLFSMRKGKNYRNNIWNKIKKELKNESGNRFGEDC